MAADIPHPQLESSLATLLARHVRATLLHLRCAEDAARSAGLNLDGTVENVRLAKLFQEAREHIRNLDEWAAATAARSSAARGTYRDCDVWCQVPGGELPRTDLSPPPGFVFVATPVCEVQHLARPELLHSMTDPATQAVIGRSGTSLCGYTIYDQTAIDAQLDVFTTRSRTRWLAELRPCVPCRQTAGQAD